MTTFWRLPLDADQHKTVSGTVNILQYRCKGCGYCIEFCPRDVLAEAKDFNEKGYHPPCVKVEGQCVNCNFCETICPEFAIYCTEAAGRTIQKEDVIQNPNPGRRRARRAR
jgi:2-oxoglutarate ferredoxin oxidoreductase subunit delta